MFLVALILLDSDDFLFLIIHSDHIIARHVETLYSALHIHKSHKSQWGKQHSYHHFPDGKTILQETKSLGQGLIYNLWKDWNLDPMLSATCWNPLIFLMCRHHQSCAWEMGILWIAWHMHKLRGMWKISTLIHKRYSTWLENNKWEVSGKWEGEEVIRV